MAYSILHGLNISDEHLKQIITEVFEQKFSYMSKMDYYRWLNGRQLAERIKKLTVELMTQEDIDKYPNFAGYYTNGTDRVKIKDPSIVPSVLDHELNHFINDNTKQFPRFINEGITEFLTQESFKSAGKSTPYVAYKINVSTIAFLYSIFGDELIKCYLSGVTPEFETKLSKYLKASDQDSLKDFYDVLEELHAYYHPYNEEEKKKLEAKKDRIREKTLPKRDKYLENILTNSIINDVLNFKFYKDSKLDLVLLVNTIFEKVRLLDNASTLRLTSEEMYNRAKKLIIIALSNTYLNTKYTQEEIIEVVNKSFSLGEDGVIQFARSHIEKMESKINNRSYHALKNKINNYDYKADNGFDYSAFMLDFFTLISSNKFENNELDIETYLYGFLYKKIQGNVNTTLVNKLIEKYSKLYLQIGTINNENLANTSESYVADISTYSNTRIFLEKRDNEYYVTQYNLLTNEVITDKLHAESNYWGRNNTIQLHFFIIPTGKRDTIYLDTENETVSYNHKKVKLQKGLKSIIDSTITSETIITNYEDYIYYLNDNDRISFTDNVMYVGGMIEDLDKRSRFINYEDLLRDLKSLIQFLPSNQRKQIVETNIRNFLKACYHSMPISDTMINKIVFTANKYIETNEGIDKLKKLSFELIKEWQKYISNIQPTGLLYFKNDEDAKNYFKKSHRRDTHKKATEFAATHYQDFIVTPNEDYFDDSIVTYGIKGVTLNASSLRNFQYPHATKIDFESLISFLAGIVDSEKDDKENCFDAFYGSLESKLFGLPLPEHDEINELILNIYEHIKAHIIDHNNIDIPYLEQQFNELIKLYKEIREQVIVKFKKDRLAINTPVSDATRELINKIKAIEINESIPLDRKRREIMILLDTINVINQVQEYQLAIDEMDEIVRKTKKTKS